MCPPIVCQQSVSLLLRHNPREASLKNLSPREKRKRMHKAAVGDLGGAKSGYDKLASSLHFSGGGEGGGGVGGTRGGGSTFLHRRSSYGGGGEPVSRHARKSPSFFMSGGATFPAFIPKFALHPPPPQKKKKEGRGGIEIWRTGIRHRRWLWWQYTHVAVHLVRFKGNRGKRGRGARPTKDRPLTTFSPGGSLFLGSRD